MAKQWGVSIDEADDRIPPSENMESGYYKVIPLDRGANWCGLAGTEIAYVAASQVFICLDNPETLRSLQDLKNLSCCLRPITRPITIRPL